MSLIQTRVETPQYNFDWDNIEKVYGKDIPKDIVQEKFRIADQCKADGTWTNINRHILDDTTIFTYLFLRYENKPIKLRYYQDAIVSDKHRFKDLECANQTGKSFALCVESVVAVLKDHGKNWTVLLASATKGLNLNNLMMIKNILRGSEVDFIADKDNDNIVLIRHDSGFESRIICTVRGSGIAYAANNVLLDEFEFWPEESDKTLMYYHDQLFLQRTNFTKGSIGIYSNPNGKNFVSEKLHKRKGASRYHVYNINFLDVPGNTREEWEESKHDLHPIIFASTRAAMRVEAEGSALNIKDIESTYSDELQRMGADALHERDNLAFFADLGFVYDQTVLTGGYSVIEFNEITKREEPIFYFVPKCYPVQYPLEQLWGFEDGSEDAIPKVVTKYSRYPYFELDLTGKEGNDVLAQKAGLTCKGVKMSGQWKMEHYDRFISLCKQGRIKVHDFENWLDGSEKNFQSQCRTLKISTKTADGRNRPYPIYHHNTEKDHDDILDSVVGCLSMIDEEMSGTYGVSRITHDGKKIEKEKDTTTEEDGVFYDDVDATLRNQSTNSYSFW